MVVVEEGWVEEFVHYNFKEEQTDKGKGKVEGER